MEKMCVPIFTMVLQEHDVFQHFSLANQEQIHGQSDEVLMNEDASPSLHHGNSILETDLALLP